MHKLDSCEMVNGSLSGDLTVIQVRATGARTRLALREQSRLEVTETREGATSLLWE